MARKKEKKQELRKKQNPTRATFKFMAPEAQCVLLAGDFNSWNPEAHPLKRSSNGLWKINLNLSPGRYEYRFLVDGQWHNDPDCKSYAPNPFGDDNCLITLK
jgi:1,4-alpha-glucan branching enzyme